MTIAERIASIMETIEKSARKSGRKKEDIILLAACKGVDNGRVAEAIRAGITVIGDNYVQEAVKRREELKELANLVEWHFIGHLQSNKARKAVELFQVIQTIDSLSLAKELDRRAKQLSKILPVLVEVNIGEEESKFGVKPSELFSFLEQLTNFKNLKIMGLMTMGPPLEKEKMRPFFAKMRELLEKAKEEFSSVDNFQLSLLSMGMSADYDVAIEEGANLVRLGTAIFGQRR
ncbi:YggS family pyridoxal phosphate-dependent enzyme [bacterium]|nr:YggS family pyridoxal phosphate-dependent enzyme [bacterium]